MSIYEVLSKLNVMLVVSAACLVFYFLAHTLRPQAIIPSGMRGRQGKDFNLIIDDPLSGVLPAFSLEVFRKKALFPTAASEQLSEPRHSFTLLGVSLGKKTLASLKDTATGEVYLMSPGDTVEEFRVIKITANKVILEADGETVEITK